MMILTQLGDKLYDTTGAAVFIDDDNRVCICSMEEYDKDPAVRNIHELGRYDDYVTAHDIVRAIAKYAANNKGAYAMPSPAVEEKTTPEG